MTEYCIVEKKDHIMTVCLNRPERLNALHSLANAELGEVFDDFDAGLVRNLGNNNPRRTGFALVNFGDCAHTD